MFSQCKTIGFIVKHRIFGQNGFGKNHQRPARMAFRSRYIFFTYAPLLYFSSPVCYTEGDQTKGRAKRGRNVPADAGLHRMYPHAIFCCCVSRDKSAHFGLYAPLKRRKTFLVRTEPCAEMARGSFLCFPKHHPT